MTWLDTELARVLDPHYLDGLSDRGLDDIRRDARRMRADGDGGVVPKADGAGQVGPDPRLPRPSDAERIDDLRQFVDDLPSIIAAGPPPRTGPSAFAGIAAP